MHKDTTGIDKHDYEGYQELLKIRSEKEVEINDLKDLNIQKFFVKLGFTSFITLFMLIVLSVPLNILLTPSLAVICFLIPTIVYGAELGIKNNKVNHILKEAEIYLKYNYPNINLELSNQQIEIILSNCNIFNDTKEIIDFNSYLIKQTDISIEEYSKPKTKKLVR